MNKTKLNIAYVVTLVIALGFIACNSNQHDQSENQNNNRDTNANTTSKSTDTSSVKKDTVEADLPQEVVDYPYPIKPSKENWQEDIGEVFVMLPDTFFLKHRSIDKNIGLNHKKRKQLVSGKKVVIDQNCIVSFKSDDEFNKINRQENMIKLSIFHSCIDGQRVSYCFRPWETIEGEKIFGLFQLYGDWCCYHSSYWFLKPTQEGWIDVTEKVVGNITLYDFKRGNQSFPKNEDFKGFINAPRFSADVYYFTDTIKFHLDFEILDLSLSSEISDSIENQLNSELQLIWNGREFKKNLIPRTDLDE